MKPWEKAELSENQQRKDLTPEEAVAAWDAMEKESPPGKKLSDSDSTSKFRRDRAAKLTGMSTDTLSKAKQVVRAAKSGARSGPAVKRIKNEMNQTGNVNRAYEQMLETTGKKVTSKQEKPMLYSSTSFGWNSPKLIIARVLKVFPTIDLDPCSDDAKKPNVPCKKCFTRKDDGLAQEWRGKVYMNPPYGSELPHWVKHLLQEYHNGHIKEAIALIPSRTDTRWFQSLRDFPRCFIAGRLRFSGQENCAPFPSMAVYLGKNVARFVKAFRDIGDVYVLYK